MTALMMLARMDRIALAFLQAGQPGLEQCESPNARRASIVASSLLARGRCPTENDRRTSKSASDQHGHSRFPFEHLGSKLLLVLCLNDDLFDQTRIELLFDTTDRLLALSTGNGALDDRCAVAGECFCGLAVDGAVGHGGEDGEGLCVCLFE